MDSKTWLTPKQFAELTGRPLRTVYFWIEKGDVYWTKIGGTYMIHREIVDQLLAQELRGLDRKEAA